jgi:PAS domain S-box-containing protein
MVTLRLSRTVQTILLILLVQTGLLMGAGLFVWVYLNRPAGHWLEIPLFLGVCLLVLVGLGLTVTLGARWRRQAEEGLRQTRHRFRHLVDSIDGIVWESNAVTLENLFVSRQAEHVLGYPVQAWYADPQFWHRHLHPEDRERVVAFFHEHEALLRPFMAEYRMLRPDGETVWIRDIVSVTAANGRPAMLHGVMLDITDRRRIQQDLERALAENQVREADLTVYKDHLEELVIARSEALLKANSELRAAREKAEESNRMKSHFLANMSHELRTPLNAIILYSQLIMDEAKALEQQQTVEDLHKIQSAGRHLLSLIDDILDLSKIEAGRITLNPEEIDLPAMIHEIVQNMAPVAQRNGNELGLELHPEVRTLQSDPTRLRQILINLLGNASKFTTKGTITIGVRPSPEGVGVLIHVRDTGIGMTREQQSRIFQRFTQADDSTTRRFGGTGLGLALSQRISELLGGALWVESQEGKGSTFFLKLPERLESVQASAEALQDRGV